MDFRSACRGDCRGPSFPTGRVLVLALGGILLFAELVVGLLPIVSAALGTGLRIAFVMVATAGLLAVSRRHNLPVAETAAGQDVAVHEPAHTAEAPPADWSDPLNHASVLSETISHFGNVSDVLKKETERVIEDTEHNAASMMEELRSVETGMEALLDFSNAAG
jgi:hypothetical protein